MIGHATDPLGLSTSIFVLTKTETLTSMANEVGCTDRHFNRLRKEPGSRPAVLAARRLRPLVKAIAHFPWSDDAEAQADAIDNLLLGREMRRLVQLYRFSAYVSLERLRELDAAVLNCFSERDWGHALFAERFFAAMVSVSAPGFNNSETRANYEICQRVFLNMLATLNADWAGYLAKRKVSNLLLARWNGASREERRAVEMSNYVQQIRYFEVLLSCLKSNSHDDDVAFNLVMIASALDRKDVFGEVCAALGENAATRLATIIDNNAAYLVNGDDENLNNWMATMTKSKTKLGKIGKVAAIGAALTMLMALALFNKFAEAPSHAPTQVVDIKPLTATHAS